MELTSSMVALNSVENRSQLVFLRLKHLLDMVNCDTVTGFTVTHIGRCYVCGMGSSTYFSHISQMFEDMKMRSGIYPFFHITLFNDFGSFALCMSNILFESTHFSVIIVVYPQHVL